MSELRIEKWTLPAANLGPENPLPPITSLRDLHAEIKLDSSVPVEEREHLGWGAPLGLLPYRMQDSIDSSPSDKVSPVQVPFWMVPFKSCGDAEMESLLISRHMGVAG